MEAASTGSMSMAAAAWDLPAATAAATPLSSSAATSSAAASSSLGRRSAPNTADTPRRSHPFFAAAAPAAVGVETSCDCGAQEAEVSICSDDGPGPGGGAVVFTSCASLQAARQLPVLAAASVATAAAAQFDAQ